jgi:hypothetical protein
MLLALALVIALLFAPAATSQSEQGRIAIGVKSAKSRGENKVELLAPIVLPTGVSTVDAVFDDYAVIIAEAVAKRVLADADNISTWYKLRTVEILAPQP